MSKQNSFSQQLNDYSILNLPNLINENSKLLSQQSFKNKPEESGFHPDNLEIQKQYCSIDNNMRLDKIVNLHDLVNFKVTTVADRVLDNQKLTTNDQLEESFKKIQQNNSYCLLQQMYDPLLQVSNFYKKSNFQKTGNKKQKSVQNIKINSQQSINQKIPSDLQQKKSDLVHLNVQSDIQQPIQKSSIDSISNDNEQISYQQNQSINYGSQPPLKSESQYNSQKIKEEIVTIDPIQQLKNFFLFKKKDKMIINNNDSFSQNSISQQNLQNDDLQNNNYLNLQNQENLQQQQKKKKDYDLKATHENYIISKYQKKKKTGQLDKEIKQRNEELKNLENIQIKIAQDQIHKIYQEVLKNNTKIEEEIQNYQIRKKVKTGIQQTSQQFQNLNEQINKPQPKSMEYKRKQIHNIEVPITINDLDQKVNDDNLNLQAQSQQTQYRDDVMDSQQFVNGNLKSAHKILKDILIAGEDTIVVPLKHKQESSQTFIDQQQSNSLKNSPFLPQYNDDGSSQIIYSQIFDNNKNQEKQSKIQEELFLDNIKKHKTLIEDIIGQRSSSQMVINKEDEYGLKQDLLNKENNIEQRSSLQSGYSVSELMKIQSVKSHIASRMYINFSEKQISMAQKLKDFELNKYKSLKQHAKLKNQSLEYNNIEDSKKNHIKMKSNQVSSYEYSDNNSNKLNIHGSLPNLRIQLESRKTQKPQITKSFIEDVQQARDSNPEQSYEIGNIQQIQIIDLSMLDILQKSTEGLNDDNYTQFQNQDLIQDFKLIQKNQKQDQNIKNQKTKLHKEFISSHESYYDPFRVVGVKVQQENKNIKGIKKQVNFGKIKKAIQSFDQANSPLKSVDSFKKSTLLIQKNFNIQMIDNNINNKNVCNENIEESIQQENQKFYKDQCEQINEYDNKSIKDEKNFKIEKSDQNFTKKTPKPNSITKSSRISIFSNQQNRSFGNHNNQMARNFANSQTLSKEYKYGQTTQAKSENNQQDQEEQQQDQDQINQDEDIVVNQIQKNQSMHMTQQRIFDEVELLNSSQAESLKNGCNDQPQAQNESEKSQNSNHLKVLKVNLLNQSGPVDLNSAKKLRIQIDSINQKLSQNAEKKQSLEQKQQPSHNFQLTDSKLPDKLHMIKTDVNSIASNLDKSLILQGLNKKTFIQIENTKPSATQPYYDLKANQKSNIRKIYSKQIKQLKTSLYQNQITKDQAIQSSSKNQKRSGSDERGYQSSNEPFMDKISSEIYDQILSDYIQKKGYWIPSRFKIFPRFTYNKKHNKTSLDDLNINQKYINLNKNMLAFLASIDLKNAQKNSVQYNEPAILNKSSIKIRKTQNNQQYLNRNHLISHLVDKNETEETINLEQSIGQESDRIKFFQNQITHQKQLSKDNQDLNVFQEQQGALQLQVQIQNKQNNDYIEDINHFQNNFKSQKANLRNNNFDKKSLETNSNQYSSMNVLDQLLYNENIVKQQIIDSIQEEQTQHSERKQIVQQIKTRKKDNFQIMEESIISEEVHKSLPKFQNNQNYQNFLLIKHFDPFEKVYLSQSMENQMLTSKRTLQKSNNIISNSFKVLHKRFQPRKMAKSIVKKFPRGQKLYPISINMLQNIAHDMIIQQEINKMNEIQRAQFIQNLEQINVISELYDIQEIAAVHLKNSQYNQINHEDAYNSKQYIHEKQKNSLLSNSDSNLIDDNNPHLNSKITDPIVSNKNILNNQNLNVDSPINNQYQNSQFTKIMIQQRKSSNGQKTNVIQNNEIQKYKQKIKDKLYQQKLSDEIQQDLQLLNVDSQQQIIEQTLSARNNSKNEDSQTQIQLKDTIQQQSINLQIKSKNSPNTSKIGFYQKQKRQNLSLPKYDITTGIVYRSEQQNQQMGIQNLAQQITKDIYQKQEIPIEITSIDKNNFEIYQNDSIKIIEQNKFKSEQADSNKNSMRNINNYENPNVKIADDFNHDFQSQRNFINSQMVIQSAKQVSEYLDASIQNHNNDQNLKKEEINQVQIINKELKNNKTKESQESSQNLKTIKIPQLQQQTLKNKNIIKQSRQQPPGLYVPILNFCPQFQNQSKNQSKTVENNNDQGTQSHRTNSKQLIHSNIQSQSNLSNNLIKIYGDSESYYKIENKKSYDKLQNIYGSLPSSQQQKQRLKKSFMTKAQSPDKTLEDNKINKNRYINFGKKAQGLDSNERMNIIIKKKKISKYDSNFIKKEDNDGVNLSSKDSHSNNNMRVTQETFHIKDDTNKNTNYNYQAVYDDFEQLIRQNSLIEKSNSKKQFSINLLEYETNFKSNNESKQELQDKVNLFDNKNLDEKKIVIQNKNMQILNFKSETNSNEISFKQFPKNNVKTNQLIQQKKTKIENLDKAKSPPQNEEDAYNLLRQVIQKTNNQNLSEISEVLVSLANNSSIKNTLATLSVSNTISKNQNSLEQNSPIKTFIETNNDQAIIDQKKKNVEYLQQLLQNLNIANESKYQVKKMIDDLYTQNKQYQKKQKNNIVSGNDFIFDSVKMNLKYSGFK